MQNASEPKKILLVVFLTMFLDMLGVGILIPIYPMLVIPNSTFKITPTTWTIGGGYEMLGWLMATFPLFQFIFTPILGQLSDKYGRRRILIISICGTAISYLIFAFGIISKNIPLLFIARGLDGISGSNISTAQAVIGDVSKASSRARNFGLISIAIGIGYITGPIFGGNLSNPNLVHWFNAATPFLFAAVMSGINVIMVLKLLPETLGVERSKHINIMQPFDNIVNAVSTPSLSSMFFIMFIYNIGTGFFIAFWGVVLATKFGFTQSGVGGFFSYYGIMMFITQGIIVRKLSGKIADYKILRYSIILVGIFIVIGYFVPTNHITWLFYILPLLAVCSALTRAFSTALLLSLSPAEIYGGVLGINSSTLALSQAIPAILAGYLASHHVMLPIVTGGVFIIFSGCLFRYKFRPTT